MQTIFDAVATFGADAHPRDVALARTYLESCFGDPIDDRLAAIAQASIMKRLGPHIGFLQRRTTREVTCTALRSGRRVLSARHCFPIIPWGNQLFHHINEQLFDFVEYETDKVYSLTRAAGVAELLPASADELWRRQDWVVLELPQAAAGPTVRISDSAVSRGQLYIPGYFRFVGAIKPHIGARPSRHVLVDLSPQCMSWVSDGPFMYHNCHTLGGVSGAPIFQFDAALDEFVLVGLHAGITLNLAETTAADCAARYKRIPNYGVKTNAEMARQLGAIR